MKHKKKKKARKKSQRKPNNPHTASVVAFEVEQDHNNKNMAETGQRFNGGQLDAPHQSDEEVRNVQPQVTPNFQGEKARLL